MLAENWSAAMLVIDLPHLARFVIASTALDVRQGLRELLASALVCGLSQDSLSTTELVLAEALNNVVEHAYADHPGEIAVEVQRHAGRLAILIADSGLPMPGDEPPIGCLPEITGFDDLPEGGFGWFLIRSLVQDLCYRREDGGNRLSFQVRVDNAA